MPDYQQALASEIARYESCIEVHELPGIFHYWSQKHLRPKAERFGFSDPADFFAKSLGRSVPAAGARILSLGAGNCDFEIGLARRLHSEGFHGFTFECIDVNRAMLERGRTSASEAGFGSAFDFVKADLNSWNPAAEYDAVIASHSLHHVVNLEGLFGEIRRSLRPEGRFIVADMIGRNGHQRWPEALEIIHEFWRRLPPSYRFNRLLGIYEELYRDWDCSGEGFEGVRAQDILPLLTDSFSFRLFIPYGNLIDPFIDRAFGPNFDADSAGDRAFIDEVHARDDSELASGRLTPTHMFAVLSPEPGEMICPDGLSPHSCIRNPRKVVSVKQDERRRSAYDCELFPRGLQHELETVGGALSASIEEIAGRTRWALALRSELDHWTAWAVDLERQFEDRTRWALDLRSELKRMESALLTMKSEFHRRDAASTLEIARLQNEFSERTAWALDLDSRLDRMTAQLLQTIEERDGLRSEVARLAEERRRLVRDPWFWLRTVAAASVRAVLGLMTPRSEPAILRPDGSRENSGR